MIRTVIGASWGDEGKGEITDMLTRESDIIIRSQGGSNADHTIIDDYGKFALHLLPSDVFYQHTTSIIGNGMALNIPYLIQETEPPVERDMSRPRILVPDRVQVFMSYHMLFDIHGEARLVGKSSGSTKSGITPFCPDKYARIGFQVSESFDEGPLREKVRRVCELKNVLLEHLYHKPLLDPEKIVKGLFRCCDMTASYVCDISAYLHKATKGGRNTLLKGQLGPPKDSDHGIYPMVTFPSTLAAYGVISTGIPSYKTKDITTVVKTYSSIVGAGASVSKVFGGEVDELRNRGGDGGEYSATTGRPRRVGWLDAVIAKYGCRIQETTEVVSTMLDVLGYLGKVPVCVSYEIGEQITREFLTTSKLEKARPVLIRLPGWKRDIRGIKWYQDLLKNCCKYIGLVEKEIKAPILMVSSGPGRDDIIMRR